MTAAPDNKNESPKLARIGIEGLDNVLGGGLVRNRLYLIEGVPGSGKTTVALQFLLDGLALGETVLYVTLSETAEELKDTADSHGWTLDGIQIRELVPSEASLQPDEHYTLFHPSEIELGDTTKSILGDVDRLKPTRVVIDSLSELRLLAGGSLRFRRQILGLKRYFSGRSSTVLLLDDLTSGDHDLQVQSIAHGVLLLEQMNPDYGADRRRLRVVKYRGRKYRGGYHDYVICQGGLRVFPRLVAADHRRDLQSPRLPSGNVQLDHLLGGGIELGTSTLIAGSPGTGKSSLAAQFAASTAAGGGSVALFLFDESVNTLLSRCAGLGIDLRPHIESGRVTVQAIDPAELSPGEFAHCIRHAVEDNGASLVVIDSLNGYLNAMPAEKYLVVQLHELLAYLGQLGVATLLIGAHQGMIGPMNSTVDISYLADAVILLRYFEARGEVHQAISVVKKRGGAHERTIREIRLSRGGIEIGQPLREFRGILTGVPEYNGHDDSPPEEPSS
jgi:circadian clock protein KaiC